MHNPEMINQEAMLKTNIYNLILTLLICFLLYLCR